MKKIKNEGLSVSIDNETIKRAFELYDQRSAMEAQSACGAPHEFSEGFEEKMKRLIKYQRRPSLLRKRFFKITAFISAAVILFSVLIFSSSGIRDRLAALFIEDHGNFGVVELLNEKLRERTEDRYEPLYIPENFVLTGSTEYNSDDAEYSMMFRMPLGAADPSQQYISYKQICKGVHVTISLSNADVKEVLINGMHGFYSYIQYGDGHYCQMLSWVQDGYLFMITVNDYGDYDMIMKIARSVARVPDPAPIEIE